MTAIALRTEHILACLQMVDDALDHLGIARFVDLLLEFPAQLRKGLKETLCLEQLALCVDGSVQAEVSDLDEARRQHVLKEAPNELDRRDGGGVAVLGVEGDAFDADGAKARVAESNSVCAIRST